MSKGTTRRSVRIEEELWEQAQKAAEERGDNLSAVIREALQRYINEKPRQTTHRSQI